MAIPISVIKTQARNWALAGSGLAAGNVIFAKQNSPEPTGTYIVVNVGLSISRYGMADEKVWRADLTPPRYVVYSQRRVRCSMQCFGPDAFFRLSAVQDALYLPTRESAFKAANLAVWTEDIRDLSGLKGNSSLLEERAQMDFFVVCGTTDDTDTSIGAFDKVEYSSPADQLDLPETLIPST